MAWLDVCAVGTLRRCAMADTFAHGSTLRCYVFRVNRAARERAGWLVRAPRQPGEPGEEPPIDADEADEDQHLACEDPPVRPLAENEHAKELPAGRDQEVYEHHRRRARKREDPKQDQGGGCRAETPQPEHGVPCDQAGTQAPRALQEPRPRQHQSHRPDDRSCRRDKGRQPLETAPVDPGTSFGEGSPKDREWSKPVCTLSGLQSDIWSHPSQALKPGVCPLLAPYTQVRTRKVKKLVVP